MLSFARAIAATMFVAALLSGHASAQPTWSIVDSPNASATRHNFLNDVDCLNGSDCWTVGYYRTDSAYQAVIEHWDGESWSLVPSPDTSVDQDDFVQAVTCASDSHCWIVGYSWSRTANAYQPLIQRWDGATWSIVPSPNDTSPENGFLYDVTCVSESECWAVGQHQVGMLGGGLGPRQTLIKRWDGNAWTTFASPNTLPTESNSLVNITCASARDCWAVGSYVSNGTQRTLTQHWDGDSWEIVASPNTDPLDENFLNGVTCASSSNCWAVGVRTSGVNQTLIQHWDGSSWSITPSPNTDTELANVLFSVACPSSSECWAAGYHKAGNPLQTLLLSWDGSSWSLAPSPNSAPGQTNTFRSVTCEKGAGCWAVGNYYNAASISRTLTTHRPEDQAIPIATEIALDLEQVRSDVLATAVLRSSDGTVLEGKEIVFSVNDQERGRVVTDAEGIAILTMHRSEIKPHDVVEARFLGDEQLASSHTTSSLATD